MTNSKNILRVLFFNISPQEIDRKHLGKLFLKMFTPVPISSGGIIE